MTKVIIRTDQVEGFFDRARKVVQKVDRGESFKKSATFSFEDLQEMFIVLSQARRHLMLKVMDEPKTITQLTAKVHGALCHYQGYWTLRKARFACFAKEV
jgi:predicted transcriptional regulator